MKKLLLTTLIATQCIGFTVYAKMNTNDRQNSDVSSIDSQLQDLSTSMHKLMQEINDLKKEKAQDQDRIMQLQSELENSQQQIEKIKSMNAHPHHKSKALITKIQDECKRAKAALDRMVPQAGLKKSKKSPAHKAKNLVQKNQTQAKKVHKAVNQKIKSKSQLKKQQPAVQDSLSSMHDGDDEIMMAAQVDAMTQPVIISPESLDEQPQAMLLADDDDKNNDIEAVLTTLDNNQSAGNDDNLIDLNVDINQKV
jgi:DNA repair ATPase RecN